MSDDLTKKERELLEKSKPQPGKFVEDGVGMIRIKKGVREQWTGDKWVPYTDD